MMLNRNRRLRAVSLNTTVYEILSVPTEYLPTLYGEPLKTDSFFVVFAYQFHLRRAVHKAERLQKGWRRLAKTSVFTDSLMC